MLQKCMDCGQMYSTLAKSCPVCGRPNQVYLNANSKYLKKQKTLTDCENQIGSALANVKVGLISLAITAIVTGLMLKMGFLTNIESQSFMEFITNPDDWGVFYLMFFIVFYFGSCILWTGSIFVGLLAFILVLAGFAFLMQILPNILRLGVTLFFFFFPLYYLFVRPIYMLVKAGYFKAKKMSVKKDRSDRYIEQMRELDL